MKPNDSMGSRKFIKYVLGPIEITEANKETFVEFLEDRIKFHTWLSSLVTGSIVFLSTLGLRPNLEGYQGMGILIGFVSLTLSLITNLACLWTIPVFKLKIKTDIIRDTLAVRMDLGIASWIGVISFLGGLLIVSIASLI